MKLVHFAFRFRAVRKHSLKIIFLIGLCSYLKICVTNFFFGEPKAGEFSAGWPEYGGID